MTSAWELQARFERLRIVTRLAASSDERENALSPSEAAWALRDVLRERDCRFKLCAIIRRCRGQDVSCVSLTQSSLAEAVLDEVASGSLLVLRCQHSVAPIGVETAAPEPPGEVEPELSWIEIEVVDDTGKPLAEGPYRITSPEGRELRGNLDEDGYVRVDGIRPGTCTVIIRAPGLEHRTV